jgi:hypothetical protein
MRSIGNTTGKARKEKMVASYTVTGCKGNYPTVRSKFVFLLPQKHPGCLTAPGKLALCARWLQKEKWKKV